MYATKSQLFHRINECLQEIDNPYQRSAIWPSNSLDKTATAFLILDRDVDSWASKSKMFECMQRNRHFFRNLTNVSRKSITFPWKSMDSQAGTPIEDPRSHPQIRGYAMWPSNSLNETASPFRILDRGVDFWGPKSKIFECMQRNRHFFWNLTNVLRKTITFLWKSIDSQNCTSIESPWFWLFGCHLASPCSSERV